MASSKVGDFTVIKKLGDGAYSSVYKVKRLDDNDVYALKKVKMLSLTEKEKENALNEVRILASIDHPNVIGFKEAFIDESSSSLCLVMEYADNGDVFQKICSYQKRETYIKEKKIWYVFIQIVRGLRAFHARKILHRDMKSANIFLFKDMQAKLGDLNVSKIVKKGLSYTQTGTPYYASPEVWKDMPYDSKSDIWSLGCVLYEMCALVPPFRADDMQGLYKMVVKGKYPRIPDHFSQEMATVIKFMLQISPNYRPTCEQILALPIVESLSKRFFAEERNKLEEIDENSQVLMKTIRMSKNLFSLTERLPKNKYIIRQRSNELIRDNSQDSVMFASNAANLITPQVVSNFKQKERDGSPGKISRASDDDDYQQADKLRQEAYHIAKPRPQGRNNENHASLPLTNLKQRNASVNKIGADGRQGRLVLNQSPSMANIQSLAEDGDIDDDQPQKPIIIADPNDSSHEQEVLPMLAQRHRSVAPYQKRMPEYKQGFELESQNSNSQAQFVESPLKLQRNSMPHNQIQAPVGHQQRVIQKVRENRVMQVYSNISPKPISLAGPNNNFNVKVVNAPILQNHRRNKSNNRAGLLEINQPIQQNLNRNSSKPQLQLPEIGRQMIDRSNIDLNEIKQQRIVSAHLPQMQQQAAIGKQAQQIMLPQNQNQQFSSPQLIGNSPQRISKDNNRVAIQRGEINLASGPPQQNVRNEDISNHQGGNRQGDLMLVKNIKKNAQSLRRNSVVNVISQSPQNGGGGNDDYLSEKEQIEV